MITKQVAIEILSSSALFILVWQVLGNKIFKPFFEILEEREAKTVGREHALVKSRENVQKTNKKMSDSLKKTRHEASGLRDKQILETKKMAQGVLEKALAEAEGELLRSRSAISDLKKQAEKDIESEAKKLSELVITEMKTKGTSNFVH